jgi:DNA-binding GntR family transcriptional regulator
MDIRAMLEARAAGLAAARISDARLAEARQKLAEFGAAKTAGRWGELN